MSRTQLIQPRQAECTLSVFVLAEQLHCVKLEHSQTPTMLRQCNSKHSGTHMKARGHLMHIQLLPSS